MKSGERAKSQRALEELEVRLVRATLATPRLLDIREETVLRTALSLARLTVVPAGGQEHRVGPFLAPFRAEVERRLGPAITSELAPVSRPLLLPHLRDLERRTQDTLADLMRHFEGQFPFEAVDQELRHKALVLVLGGGGGTAYVYLGALALLDELGLRPKLLSGTSMGAVIGLFRSRMPRFQQDEVANIVRSLSWRKLFRAVSMENRYGVPAALRLFLRSGIGRWFGVTQQGGVGVRLDELPVKTIVAATGIRQGKLPHSLTFYEELTRAAPDSPLSLKVLPRWLGAIAEFVARPELLVPVHFGWDAGTHAVDALDAAGFSCALPGVIHYDVLRDDPRMHALLAQALSGLRVGRLVDGGLVDNLPAKVAWQAVQSGAIATRNALVLALNGFSTKWTMPAWLPLMRLAELNVKKNRPWAHVVHDFDRTLGPLDIVPSVDRLIDAIEQGKESFAADLPLVHRLLTPLPAIFGAPA